jgi:hypothetical protein
MALLICHKKELYDANDFAISLFQLKIVVETGGFG